MTRPPFTVLQPYGVPATPGGLDNQPLYNYTVRRVAVTGTTYTLQATDSGSYISFNNATGVVLTIPGTLPEGFSCLLFQRGTGPVSLSFGSGATNLSATGALDQQYQYATIFVETNVDDAHAEILVISNVSVDAPANGVAPVISGTAIEGRTLQASTGVWSPTPTAYSYQWRRSGTPIGGATTASYVLTSDDLGNVITCAVTASNANGSNVSVTTATDIVQSAAVSNSVPVISILPQINGTPTEGLTLTVSTGTWLYAPTSYAFQWKRSGTPISGATAASYQLVATDVGKQITVTVTATNGNGSTNATTPATDTVVAGSPVNISVPVISGSASVGQTLTTTNGAWTGSPTSYTYQWKRGGANISAATSASYTLVIGDLAAVITVTVTATNAIGNASATSAGTSAIAAAGSVPANTVAPAITGTAAEGSTLTVSNGTWTNTPTSYTYQWNRAGSPISGATSTTYVLVSADVGSTLTCTVTAINGSGSGSAVSAATATITAATAWTPAALGSLVQHWYDAQDLATITKDGSNNVTQWNDKSGNNFHAVQATTSLSPVYNSSVSVMSNKPALQTTGGTQIMNIATGNIGALSVFALNTNTALNITTSTVTGNFKSGNFSPVALNGAVWSTTALATNTTPYFRFDGSSYTSGANLTPSTAGAVYAVAAPTTSTASGGGNAGTIIRANSGAPCLFNRVEGDRGWAGWIGEIIIIVGELSSTDRDKLEGYLAWKWATNGYLPTTHPYYSAAP